MLHNVWRHLATPQLMLKHAEHSEHLVLQQAEHGTLACALCCNCGTALRRAADIATALFNLCTLCCTVLQQAQHQHLTLQTTTAAATELQLHIQQHCTARPERCASCCCQLQQAQIITATAQQLPCTSSPTALPKHTQLPATSLAHARDMLLPADSWHMQAGAALQSNTA
jgi:hypothetical protein